MAETIKEAMETVDAIGNEFANGAGEGSEHLMEMLGIDDDELYAAFAEALDTDFPDAPDPAKATLGMQMHIGFIYGVRWQQERERG